MILLDFLSGFTRLSEWSSIIVSENLLTEKKITNFPLNTKHKLNVHKTSQTSHEHLLHV